MGRSLQPGGALSGAGGGPSSHEGADSGVQAPPALQVAEDCLMQQVLVLNRLFAPISLTSVRRGVVLLFTGSALALDEHGDAHDFVAWRTLPVRGEEDCLPILGGRLRLPRVLHLTRYERLPASTSRLTRSNLMLRDGYACQYCGAKPGPQALDVDHVLPRCRGGGYTWQNLVTSCRRCNLRKGRRTPEEAAMPLARPPVRPRWSLEMRILLSARRRFAEWEPWLRH